MMEEPAAVLVRNIIVTIVMKVALRVCWKGFDGSKRSYCLLAIGNRQREDMKAVGRL